MRIFLSPEQQLNFEVQVVVRVRPQLAKGIPKWSKEVCVHAVSSCSVVIAAPEESQT